MSGFRPGGRRPPFFARDPFRMFRGGGRQRRFIVLGFLDPVLAASSTSSGSSGAAVLLPLLLMGLIFYFLLIRPQRRQRQAHQRLVQSVDVGDEVVTIGGLYGTVRAVDDESLTLEVAPNVEVRFSRAAIARKLVYDEEYEDEYQDAADDDQSEPQDDEDQEQGQQPSKQAWRSGPWFSRSGRRRDRNEEAGDQP
jgi:preprotein translocase subunit YajC